MKVSSSLVGLICLASLMSCNSKQRPLNANQELTAVVGNTVFGNDDRNRSYNSTYDEKKVGQLRAFYKDSNSYSSCTASIIHKNLLVTAAHCVFDAQKGQKYERIEFFPALKGPENKDRRYIVSKAWVLNEYIPYIDDTSMSDYGSAADIAILELVNPHHPGKAIGDNYGWFGSGFETISSGPDRTEFEFKLISFPGDKPLATKWIEEGCEGYFNGTVIKHYCDTYVGSSGSAMLKWEESWNAWKIIGVNSGENNTANTAAIFTSEIYAEINKIIHNNGSGVEKFTPYYFDTTKIYHTWFKNECYDKIQVAVYYIDMERQWKTEGWYNIEPGQKLEIVTSEYNYFYYKAHRTQESVEWSGDDRYRELYGDTVAMRKIERKNSGDHTLSFCN